MKVLIIPEDPANDQYILKPVVEKIFAELSRIARIEVLYDPWLRGASQALSQQVVEEIVTDNPMVNLFLLIVDRDCDREKNSTKAAARELEHQDRLIACLPREELEVWMLALYRSGFKNWADIQAECDPKERFAWPFLEKMGWDEELGGGYKRAMDPLSKEWKGLLAVCPELKELRDRIAGWLSTGKSSPLA